MNRIIIGLVILLAACTAPQQETTQKSLITACGTYAVSLSTLADFRAAGKLSQGVQDSVDKVVQVVSPICSDTSRVLPRDLDQDIAVVTVEAKQLATIIAGVPK